jgi:hypothetical protein
MLIVLKLILGSLLSFTAHQVRESKLPGDLPNTTILKHNTKLGDAGSVLNEKKVNTLSRTRHGGRDMGVTPKTAHSFIDHIRKYLANAKRILIKTNKAEFKRRGVVIGEMETRDMLEKAHRALNDIRKIKEEITNIT